MNIHEYQGKQILKSFGVAIQEGIVAETVDQAVEAAKQMKTDYNSDWVVIKAQVHAGGRGKGGGVKLAKNLDEVKQRATDILGMQLVTPQTSAEGKKVHKSAVKIRKHIINFTPMEAVVTSLSRPAGSPGDFGVIVRINNEDYLLNFNIEKFTRIVPWLIIVPWNNEFQQLRNLKVNDKIIIRSHGAGAITNFPYLNILGEYVERNGEIIYKRPIGKGC